MQDAHGFQRLNQFFHRFIICDFLFLLLPRVLIGAPRWVMIDIAALHRVGEDAAQTTVDSVYRRFGERLSVGFIFLQANGTAHPKTLKAAMQPVSTVNAETI